MEHYDVIIIGTGAGGGTLAYRLAPSGKRILLLERGAFLPREKQNWDVNAVFLQNRYVSQDTWYDSTSHVSRSCTMTWRGPASTRPRRQLGFSSMNKPPSRAGAFAVTRAMASPALCMRKRTPKSSVCDQP